MELIVPYHIRYSRVVASFIEEAGSCFGADEMERKRLRLIGEEAYNFILDGIPEKEFDALFHLKVAEEEGALFLQFSNHGRPMDVRHIPEFAIEDPNGTINGLSLKLLHNLCDELLYRNLGRQGWELLITFKLRQDKNVLVDNEAEPAVEAQKETEIFYRRAGVEDVPGLINLVYDTYRYSYIKSLFYDKEQLSEAIQSGKVLSVIAITGNGRIIGHNGVTVESDWLGEVGMSMVEPSFRGSNIFLTLKRVTFEEVGIAFPNMMLYAHTVTSHKASQAFAARNVPCMLFLSVFPLVSFVGIEHFGNTREGSILFLLKLSSAWQSKLVYVPEEHYNFLNSMFLDLGLAINLAVNNHLGEADESQFQISSDIENQNATLHLIVSGKDLQKSLRQQTRKLQQTGIISFYLYIKTWEAQEANLDFILQQNGYFFSGMWPNPDGTWHIVYTNLLHQSFDFNHLQLFSPRSKALAEYVRTAYLLTL